jgi:hypothetical protein
MKADSGSLVYILISVALLIISSLGKKKKPVNPPAKDYTPEYEPETQVPTPRQTHEWPKDLEDVFGKMFDVEIPKPAEKPQTYEKETVPETPYFTYDSYKPENESLEVIADENQTLETIKSNEYERLSSSLLREEVVEEKEEEPAFAFDGSDLEKAVIYAEIVNRKYF